MAVKIRLARRGRKKMAIYDVVVADARAPRDGRFIEKIGTYNPNTPVAAIELDNDKAFQWLMNGAQPTDTVRAMLSYRGLLYKKHLQIGVIKGAMTQEDADKKLEAWMKDKEATIEGKEKSLADKAAAEKKARLEAETKVNEARAEAIKKRQEEAEAEAKAAEAPAEEEVTEEAPAAEAGTEEAPKAESTEEAPKEEASEEKSEEEKKED
ncbi:30S ribosomal protein S16 [Marivirga harenae]|uniref:30S ribosomal protein S16 n=1 Tax=Marivirga harenae TaxID=2010992 RepID=UPI0026E0A676|nr:30S ribosomal protein S16 [Marivirga harenae]WKV12831.1 30S ribosomal protein S16 [Marivirga harenae]|tara:strand:+ start:26822 stop:27451 length:630 start_codon:yes stop_codon:yes gene_type:complete